MILGISNNTHISSEKLFEIKDPYFESKFSKGAESNWHLNFESMYGHWTVLWTVIAEYVEHYCSRRSIWRLGVSMKPDGGHGGAAVAAAAEGVGAGVVPPTIRITNIGIRMNHTTTPCLGAMSVISPARIPTCSITWRPCISLVSKTTEQGKIARRTQFSGQFKVVHAEFLTSVRIRILTSNFTPFCCISLV